MATWNFGPLTLPIEPASIQRSVARKQVVDKIVEQLPFAIDLGPDTYEVNIKGLIYPTYKVTQLWELVKKGENPSIEIYNDDPDFALYNGRYAIARAVEGVNGPNFIADGGFVLGVGPVHTYDITFVQFGDSGLISDGNTGDLELDDDGIGFGDINVNLGDFNFGDFLFSFDDILAG